MESLQTPHSETPEPEAHGRKASGLPVSLAHEASALCCLAGSRVAVSGYVLVLTPFYATCHEIVMGGGSVSVNGCSYLPSDLRTADWLAEDHGMALSAQNGKTRQVALAMVRIPTVRVPNASHPRH